MVTTDELREQLKVEPHEGDIYYNPRRGNCLRIKRIYKTNMGWRADCLSFRPDGARGGVPLSMWVSSLETYLAVTKITVETTTGTYQWTPNAPLMQYTAARVQSKIAGRDLEVDRHL